MSQTTETESHEMGSIALENPCNGERSTPLRTRWLAMIVMVAAMSTPLVAFADDTAADLMRRGKTALKEKRGEDARNAFTEALTLAQTETSRWQMQLGLALAFVLEERFVDAAYAYRGFLRASAGHEAAQTETWQLRRSRAQHDLNTLEKTLLLKLARLDVQSDPPGARVSIDDRREETWITPAVIYVEPGQHRIAMGHEHHQREALLLTVEPGQQPLIFRKLTPIRPDVQPAAVQPAAVQPTPSTYVPDATPPTPVALSVPGALALATGVALVIAGGAVHWTALRDADEVRGLQGAVGSEENVARDQALRNRIESYQTTYVTLYIAGGAGALAGATMLLLDSLHEPASRPLVSGWLGRDEGGVMVRGSW